MYVVIAGAGNVGTHIASSLLGNGHSVAVVESDKKRFEDIEALDVLAVRGNAACPSCLSNAGINSADMMIAVSGSDETNIIACVIAKSKGCKTIARLRNPDYMTNGTSSGSLDTFGIDLAVSPEMVTANHISRILLLPSLVDSGELAEGQSLIIEIKVNSGNPSIGRMPASIKLPEGALICSVSRGDTVLDPESSGAFRQGDRAALLLASRALVQEAETAFGVPHGNGTAVGGSLATGMDKFVIVGANRTGIQIAKSLEADKTVVVIDKKQLNCENAAEALDKAMVINGDATDSVLFKDEGIEDANVLVATTSNTELNMLSCLLAKKLGIAKTVAIVDEPEFRQLFEQVGVDIAVSPRMMTVDFIIRHISGKEVSTTQTALHGSGIIVMEVPIKETLWMAGKEFGNVRFPKGCIVGSVIRDGKAIKPTRFDTINPGDRLILMVRQDVVAKVEKVFSYHSVLGKFR